MRIVVTGAGGFLGSHLVTHLRGSGHEVEGWARPGGTARGLRCVDAADAESVRQALAEFAPDAVFHLAAQSFPQRSWQAPAATLRCNVEGTLHILEGARDACPRSRVLVAGSSAEYAPAPPDAAPIKEEAPLLGLDPYGASKIAGWHLSTMYARRYGMDVVYFRPFAVIGPGKVGDVCSDFARRLVAHAQHGGPIATGGLDAVRDFLDVGDAVRGLEILLERAPTGGCFNLASGVGTKVREILERLAGLAGLEATPTAETDLLRVAEHAYRVGDTARLRALGWQTRTTLSESLARVLAYWQEAGSPTAPSRAIPA